LGGVKLSLRITLLGSIIFLMLVTFAVVWISATRGLRSSVETMAQALSLEALARVEEKTQAQLADAEAASTLAADHILEIERSAGRPLRYSDLPAVTDALRGIMRVYPGLSFLSVSLAEHGEYAHVQRSGGVLSAVEMTRPIGGVATQRYIAFENTSRVVTRVDPNHHYDPRTRPFFKDAARARRSVWTDSYPFVEPGGVSYPGLSLAVPVYSRGRLAYVITADFSSASLCHFLQGIKVGRTGYAFVVDDRADGNKVLLAHPNPELLLEKKGRKAETVRLDRVADSALRESMKWIAAQPAKTETLSGKIIDATAINDAQRDTPQRSREYFVSYGRIGGTPTPGLSMGAIVPTSELTGQLAIHERTITVVGIAALISGLIFSWLISMAVARPLNAAVRQLAQVGQMQFDLPPVMSSGLAEVNELAGGIDQMKLGLRSFSRYVPTDLVRRVLASGAEPALGGEVRQLTVHFCDIAGFTAIAENLPPDELLKLLSECLGELSEEITLSGGTIDKYIGDNIMAFWGAPEPLEDHAARACHALLRNRERMKRLRERWSERSLPSLYTRMALHTGQVIVGNIGSEHRLNYTVLGDTVNVASRLENLNRLYGTEILISETTQRAVGEELIARPVDWVRVAGREEALLIHEPFGFREELDDATLRRACEVKKISERALSHYRARRWGEAITNFNDVLLLLPNDGVATVLKTRCERYQDNPPGSDWRGADQTTKL
jgi:adenylate cyclase